MKLRHKDANATELHFKNGNIFFFSYDTPVAARINSKYYKTSEYHSATTRRHINRFLHGDTVNATAKPQYFFTEEIERIQFASRKMYAWERKTWYGNLQRMRRNPQARDKSLSSLRRKKQKFTACSPKRNKYLDELNRRRSTQNRKVLL